MKSTYEELEAKCAGLAEESVNKSRCLAFFASVIKSGEEWTTVCQHEYDSALQTPATDAFLAEVRAQGVEGFLKFCGEENSVFVEAKAYYRSLSDAVDEFAAQLRKGASL